MFTAIPATPAHRDTPATFRHQRKAGIGVLRKNLNMDLIFPIHDEISAWLMCLKAEMLYDAGIINDRELDTAIERAAAVIGQPEKNDWRTSPLASEPAPRRRLNLGPQQTLARPRRRNANSCRWNERSSFLRK